MFRRIAFVVVTMGEVFFCIWALFRPLGYAQYAYGFNLFLGGFDTYLFGAAILSILSSLLFWYRWRLELVTIMCLALMVFWLATGLSPTLLGYFTISLPLFICFGLIRFLMSIISESESRGMEDVRYDHRD